jgi:predicted porin
LSANAIGGALNGQGALRPTNGVSESAVIVGLKYVTGPLTVGVEAEKAWYQGNVVLTGVTQRRAQGIAAGANYVVAPGFTVFGEYMYEEIYQGANNFITGVAGTSASAVAGGSLANNTAKAQGFLLGNVINF